MPFTVEDLLAVRELHLSLVAGAGGRHRVIEAAHVSELLRPGEWLQGGELLMTMGLVLPVDRDSCRAFVRDVVDGGASALALGLGHGQPHRRPPATLVEAAEEAGLPLLTVPDQVPFIAVTKAVFAARATAERRALEHTADVQRRLTVAAASGSGLDGVLKVWLDATGRAAVVTDALGRRLAAVGADPERLLDASRTVLEEITERGLRGSAVVDAAGGLTVGVQPIGARRLRGHVLLASSSGSGPAEARHRLIDAALVSLLTLELERRHLAREPHRRARTAAMGRLTAGGMSAEQAERLLATLDVSTGRLRGLAVRAAPGEAEDLAADLSLALPGGLVRFDGDVVEALVVDEVEVAGVLGRFASGRPAGIGSALGPGTAAVTLRQARSLLGASARLGRPAEATEHGVGRLLLTLGPPDVLAAFADATLAPIDAADPRGDILATLRVWLDANGVWDTAAERLGVHRHTVRNRIDRVEKLTGKAIASAAARHELWLALEARDALAHTAPYRR
ncbi:PucR family transcriptional regulator [Actinomadura spongiicola]|uniref:PucR family transcriptional regulator n=1 Tax=Actinomadura spongiicola TaxID=2303421 RepID=A0A372GPK1_9ACTN|nr:PucR family transcriptional regulator [Actinomadura spongiicola]RFS87317.1 PucR family transcriptional regulator [Actinomadura spongiicola]